MILSVVIATLNCRSRLKFTLDSLKASLENLRPTTIDSIEYVLVDGDSIDDTVLLFKSYKFPNSITVIQKPLGVYPAMQEGILNSSGRYCFFLNAGDLLLPTALKRFFDDQRANNKCQIFAYAKVNIFCKNGISSSFITPSLRSKNKVDWWHSSTIYSRDLLLQNPFDFSYPIAADWHQMLRIKSQISQSCVFTSQDPFVVFFIDGISSRIYATALEYKLIRKAYLLQSGLRVFITFLKNLLGAYSSYLHLFVFTFDFPRSKAPKNLVVFARTTNISGDSRALRTLECLRDRTKHIFCLARGSFSYIHQISSLLDRLETEEYSFTLAPPHGSSLASVSSFLLLQFKSLFFSITHRNSISYFILTDLDTAFPLCLWLKLLGIPYIYDIYDIFSDSRIPKTSKNIPSLALRVLSLFFDAFEHIVCSNAYKVILPDAMRIHQKYYLQRHKQKISIVPNAPLPSDISKAVCLVETSNFFKKLSQKSSQFDNVIAYCGTLSYGRYLETLADVVHECPNSLFLVAGKGPMQHLFNKINRANFVFLSSLTYHESLAVYLLSDSIFCGYDRNYCDNHFFVSPNKFWEARLLRRGLIVDSDNYESALNVYNQLHVYDGSIESLKQCILKIPSIIQKINFTRSEQIINASTYTLGAEHDS